jgi:hypothetical protein
MDETAFAGPGINFNTGAKTTVPMPGFDAELF